MPTGYNIIGDIQYENMLLRAKYEELKEKNDKLCEELADYQNEMKKEKSELLYRIVKFIMYLEFGFFVGLFIQTY